VFLVTNNPKVVGKNVRFLRLQQVSPVLCAACARQRTHVAACHPTALPWGFGFFRLRRKNHKTHDKMPSTMFRAATQKVGKMRKKWLANHAISL
jgi:hypothetical protein